MEFEWIRQFYVQGKKHYDSHVWWQDKMECLVQYWHQLQARTVKALEAIFDAARKYNHMRVSSDVMVCYRWCGRDRK